MSGCPDEAAPCLVEVTSARAGPYSQDAVGHAYALVSPISNVVYWAEVASGQVYITGESYLETGTHPMMPLITKREAVLGKRALAMGDGDVVAMSYHNWTFYTAVRSRATGDVFLMAVSERGDELDSDVIMTMTMIIMMMMMMMMTLTAYQVTTYS
jgi:hypothetical protein